VTPEAIGLPYVQSVIHIHRHCERHCSDGPLGSAITEGDRWFASSLSVEEIGNGVGLAQIIRNQWSIENKNHWPRDANWKEDKSRCRTPSLARALAVLRGPVLTLANSHGTPHPELFLACTQSPSKARKIISSPRQN
jgi:hypothetical protein